MKRNIKRFTLLVMLLAALCVLSACGFNSTVEDLFALPSVPDEYTGLNEQINEMLSNGYEYAPPTAGQNIQSVQMEDLDGDGTPEAVVFLRKPNDEKPMKVMVFQQQQRQLLSVKIRQQYKCGWNSAMHLSADPHKKKNKNRALL